MSFANVSVLRLDQIPGPAPGNKSFKLAPYFEQATRDGVRCLVSFGGAWSNHLHALAASGAAQGFETVGIVRAEAHEGSTAMLEDAAQHGMHIERIGRALYRQRSRPEFIKQIEQRYGPCIVIPEGGASREASGACAAIADLIEDNASGVARVMLAVGTGTTLAGVVSGLKTCGEVIGISALRGAQDLDEKVASLIAHSGVAVHARWHINHEFHCGGFARSNAALRDFVKEFEAVQGVPLDPVYTAKLMYGVAQLRQRGDLPLAQPTVVIHTGGLQGRRGQRWMPPL